MKVIGYIALAVIAVIGITGLTIGFDLFGLAYNSKTADIRGKSGAEVKIESAASRIDRYEYFFALCASIQEKEDVIDSLKAAQSMEQQKKDVALMANAAQRSALISKYNAESSKGYTSARFKSSDLPYRIERAAYDGTNKTGCAY